MVYKSKYSLEDIISMDFQSMSIIGLIKLSTLIDNGIKLSGDEVAEYPSDNIGAIALSVVDLFSNPKTERTAIDIINKINYLIVLKNETSRSILVEENFLDKLKSENADTPKFVIYNTVKGFMFAFTCNKTGLIAYSSTYTRIQNCYNGIRSVKANSSAAIEDLIGNSLTQSIPCPKYMILLDGNNEYRFILLAKNGEPLLNSDGYEAKELCISAIKKVQEYSEIAIIVRG